MDHLSGLDAAFLHLESPETPMHVGGLSILELPADYSGDFMQDVRTHIQNRMHMAPIFQRKLINMPFDIANPIWVMDEALDIDYHIRHVIVPPPVTRATVDKLVARLHSSLLDRSRPLWEMVYPCPQTYLKVLAMWDCTLKCIMPLSTVWAGKY